jgi:hypothetical protein
MVRPLAIIPSPNGDWSRQTVGSRYHPRPVLNHHPGFLVLRVLLIMMFAGAGGIVVGSLASTQLLGINQDVPVSPAASGSTRPLFASKQAHEWLERSLTSGRWVSPEAQALRAEYVSLPGKARDSMKRGVAMADNGKRAPQSARIQF